MKINDNISNVNISHNTSFKPLKREETSYKGEEVKDEVILTPKAKAEINIDAKLKQEVKEKLALLGNKKYKEIPDSKNPKRTAYLELKGNELIETIINKGVNPPQCKKITYNLDQDNNPLKKDYQHFKEINNQVERSTHITLTKKEDGSINKDPHPIEEEKLYSWDELAPKNKNKLEPESKDKVEESKTPSSQTSKTEEVKTKQEAVAAPIESKDEETQEIEERVKSLFKAAEDWTNVSKTGGEPKEKPYKEALGDFSNFVIFYLKEDYKKIKEFPPDWIPIIEKDREILKGLMMENKKKSSNLNDEDKVLRLATMIMSYNNKILKTEGSKSLNLLDPFLHTSAWQLLNSKDREIVEKADQMRKE
ncbi:MAG: hypothetical protein HYU63_05525 [Armatimonadetes bacterium]|nr:hypothetical protein [Armatimonadota bacterium]